MTAPTTTTVHVLRHGEVHNPDGILYGRLPGFRLSELGERMAAAVADALADHDVTHVVASPMERAQQTATPIAERFGLPVVTDDRLIESENFFEGRRVGVGDGALRHPRYWPKLVDPFTPSWGEPYTRVAQRMFAAALAAAEVAAGHQAVLVSHQLPIVTLRRFAEGRRLWHHPRRRQCALASMTSIDLADGRVTGVRYSEPAAGLVARSENADERGA